MTSLRIRQILCETKNSDFHTSTFKEILNMPIDNEKVDAVAEFRKMASFKECSMVFDVNDELLQAFNALDEEKKRLVVEFAKQLILTNVAHDQKISVDSNRRKGPLKRRIPLYIDGVSLSELIVFERSESDQ
jgi:hypothetical protein